uniref:rRNA N(6)-adenosine-methyltransferase ZCCHC4 n=1 Tax=Varanus komodoensis TaxID=61221 RepID=A0A8D2J852_VARKO
YVARRRGYTIFGPGPEVLQPLFSVMARHSPTLLFAKILEGKEEGRRFYACSACRERKDCNFFQWENEKVSEARLATREKYNQSHQPPFSHTDNVERYKEFIVLPQSERKFCRECQQLLLPQEWGRHSGHQVLNSVSFAQLKKPSQLLSPLENKKTNAQYLFTDRSCQFLLDLIVTQGFKRVLCVGTPRLHELIKLQASHEEKTCVKSLLLDIDFRYSQFYTEDDFCHYNMFNHYFFAGKGAYDVCQKFLQQDKGKDVIMVADPPFGGLVEALAFSFKKLIAMWSKTLPILWIFPYFFESRILEFFPNFCMLDYQVDYDNHALYKHGKTGRKQSPVRIFTNLAPHLIVLPAEEGYRFCALCQRYVSLNNQHCEICNSCTSKDGRQWIHCNLCKKCVKSSWIHCSICDHCALPSHSCKNADVGCFICGARDHKRSACPNIKQSFVLHVLFCRSTKKAKQKKKKVKANAMNKTDGKRSRNTR